MKQKLTEIEVQAALAVGDTVSGKDLSGLDLAYLNLTGADFSNCDLRYTNFGEADLSNGNFYVIKSNGEKININLKYTQVMDGDIIFVEQNSDVNRWAKFKEIMSVLGQIATLLVVVNQ